MASCAVMIMEKVLSTMNQIALVVQLNPEAQIALFEVSGQAAKCGI